MKEHIKLVKAGFIGNYAYASPNSLNLWTTSRRDDILSLLFLLYNLLTGEIYGKPSIPDRIIIFKQREVFSKERIENAKELTEFAEYAYSLAFEEKPNYSKIRFLLTKVLLDCE